MSDSSHWADAAAEKLIAARPDRDVYTCASGISPSGPVHVGNLRDLVTIQFVGKALAERGKRTRLIHSWDEFDRFRKVPTGLPAEYAQYIGRPLTSVPDPDGAYPSYARRHEQAFEDSLRPLGIRVDYRYQTALYTSGAYGTAIVEAVRARFRIFDIIESYRTDSSPPGRRADYLPLTVYCSSCGRDSTRVALVPNEDRATYVCEDCGHLAELDLRTASNIKLPWKVDWAMRWRHEGVVFEPAGKDHATKGGSFEVASQISKEIFGYEPPVFQPYEFIGLKGITGKMSSSTGQLLTPGDVLEVYQPEVLLWLFARVPPNRAFDLALDDGIYRLYDEFDRCLAGEASALDSRALQLALLPGRQVAPVPFRQLAGFAGLALGNRGALESIFQRLGAPWRLKDFEERLQTAERWLERYAPEERTTLLPSANEPLFSSLTERERDWLQRLVDWFTSRPGFTVDEVTTVLYDIPKAPEMAEAERKAAQKRFFHILYGLLFGANRGPRLGTFFAAVSPETYLSLLHFAAPTRDLVSR